MRLSRVLSDYWRPVLAWELIAVIAVNEIVIPLLTRTPADVVPLIAAAATLLPLAAIRTYEKKHDLTPK